MSETLKEIEVDALGEILNISMGSAATAVSTMLDTKVEITTPQVQVKVLDEISTSLYEPAMIVKITYVDGISGSNVMVFRQSDMKEILGKLMGMEITDDVDFNFDEIAMSAACEVMNQMMGSSATALSEFLGRTIDISPPDAYLMDEEHTFKSAIGLPFDREVVATNFKLVIGPNINSEYMSIMSVDLAKTLVSPFVGDGLLDENPIENNNDNKTQNYGTVPEASVPLKQEAPTSAAASGATPPSDLTPPQAQNSQPGNPMQQQNPLDHQVNSPMMPQPSVPPMGEQSSYYGYPPQGYPYGYMPGYPYGYPYPPQMPPQGQPPQANVQHVEKNPVNVQNVNLPRFNMNQPIFNAPVSGNVDLIMNVPLGVSVELGRTKRKVKDILEFTQGTVIELEKQAGAAADIIVNGQLIARGDVVVMDDNFGVRITEIINIKDLIANGEQTNKD